MKLKRIKQHKFHAEINKVICNGQVRYTVKYKPFKIISVLWGKSELFNYRIKKLSCNGSFKFLTEAEAELYLNNIEKPEETQGKFFQWTVIYPKGGSMLKKYGYFAVRTGKIKNGLQDIGNELYFDFDDEERYGNRLYFHNSRFFNDLEYNYKRLIESRNLAIDDKFVKKLTITSISNASLDDIKKASAEISSLHNELQTFYDNQNKMMDFISKLNKNN